MRYWFLALLLTRTAAAEPSRVAIEKPDEAFLAAGEAAPYLLLNRCSGGCAITGGSVEDAASNVSSIITPGSYIVREFENSNGDTGALADAEWAAVVRCMQEVYSPYAITVSDAPPPAGTLFNEAIIAGQPTDVGFGFDILGISPIGTKCTPQGNVISYSFANHHGVDSRVLNICWTAAQESAHAYGLDHEFVFSDGSSACSDPMTYRTDCGGQKFFRNKRAKCGETIERPCRCNSSQNSHQQLLAIFGAGTPITASPHATMVYPTNDSVVTSGWVTHVSAGSPRGVARVELYLNDSRWMVMPGAKFGPSGQPDSTYTFYLPTNVPDGIIDIQAKAYDDLGFGVATVPITVTKGAPCTNASQCLANQTCDAGRCKYPAPAGELGDSCDYGQFCKSWLCLGDGDKQCTQECLTDEPTSCPADFECLHNAETGTAGYCWPIDNGGCCSVDHDRRPLWLHGSLALVVLGWLRRRRR
ncbi:MAG TPA: MYXO-CTERM sorting domain-containing protein [Kofleriaceae bacterium]